MNIIKVVFDKTFLRFIIVGIINTGVGTAIMFGLYNFAGLGYWISSAANYVLTSILSFFLNKYFTFRKKEWSIFMIFSFAFVVMASYLVAYGVAKPIVYAILRSYPKNVCDNISLFFGMCLFVCCNYTGQRFLTFNRRPSGKVEKYINVGGK
ncbi:MAG: GtrA family protein [Treponema sp.]|jgi:putative flippase GtrA|nr:GtrA family protein [Treponema sp.]